MKVITKERAVEHMVDWFLTNYEHPAESTPHDEGDYVYIWGDPVEADEELEEAFGDVLLPELIAAAVKKLQDEHDVDGWVPVPPSIEEEDDEDEDEDEDDSPPTYAVIAACERCGGEWALLAVASPPEHLEGACMNCQKDSDTEKPLTFRLKKPFERVPDLLPMHWIAGYEP